MIAPITALFQLCISLFVGTMLASLLPMALTLLVPTIKSSPPNRRVLTTLGAGILVGAALCVIPEGIETVFGAHEGVHAPPMALQHRTRHLLSGIHGGGGDSSHSHSQRLGGDRDAHAGHAHGPPAAEHIGLAMVLGFLMMLLLERCSHSFSFSRNNNVSGSVNSDSRDTKLQRDAEAADQAERGRRNRILSFGLFLHAALDGVALGAVILALSSSAETSLVTPSLMLHKAHIAFGYSAFLLHLNYEPLRIVKQMAVFACAAPVLAIITFISLGGSTAFETSAAHSVLGLWILFSAGVLVFSVTVHVLPIVQEDGRTGLPIAWSFMFVLAAGICLPLLML